MKVVAITGVQQCELVDKPQPVAKDEWVVVEIEAAPMCTEVQLYRKGENTDWLGHEAAGRVTEVARPGQVKVGDRVVVMPNFGCGRCELCLSGEHIHCRQALSPRGAVGPTVGIATYAQFCSKQDWLLVPIPEDISTEHASMACCGLGPTFNAMGRMNVTATDTVLISGLGAVGLGGVINAVSRGARVIALEGHPYRAELGRTLGVERVIDPADPDKLKIIQDLTGGRGVDKSVETSSAEEAAGFLVQAARPMGQVASVGWGGPMLARDLVAKGLTVHGVWHWNHFRDGRAMMQTIRRSRALLDKFITHRFPMSQVRDAWELQMTGRCGKVVLDPRN